MDKYAVQSLEEQQHAEFAGVQRQLATLRSMRDSKTFTKEASQELRRLEERERDLAAALGAGARSSGPA
jgi:FixJ family two-component response regulator